MNQCKCGVERSIPYREDLLGKCMKCLEAPAGRGQCMHCGARFCDRCSIEGLARSVSRILGRSRATGSVECGFCEAKFNDPDPVRCSRCAVILCQACWVITENYSFSCYGCHEERDEHETV